MKNFIPLVLAVLLGLAAVLAVGRLLKARNQAKEPIITVVAVARDVVAGDVLTADSIMKKQVPVSARPAQGISWNRSEMVVGQKAMHSIAQGDYVLLTDVGLSRSMGDIVGEGEWAVSLSVPPGGIARIVQPGDEVAVIGTFPITRQVKSADLSLAPEKGNSEMATMVLFPRVRVLDVGAMASAHGAEDAGGGEIILALPPQQAQVLVAAQRRALLTLALRRPGDEAAINRLDVGMVDEATFAAMLQGVDSVKLPKIPGVLSVGTKEAKPQTK
ncbi:MAG: Flp pilus assembly protein CpaB [bacterium]